MCPTPILRCNLPVAIHGKKMHKQIVLVVKHMLLIIRFFKYHDNHGPPIHDQNYLFMHYYVTSCNRWVEWNFFLSLSDGAKQLHRFYAL